MKAVVAESDHERAVNAWLQGVAARSTEELLRAFEAGFGALWQRAHLTLGDMTLVAIVDRVLRTAKEQYPVLASIEATPSGLCCQRLQTLQTLQTLPGIRHGDFADAIRFVLTEFLTVLGNLTAQILTPALQAELSRGPPVTAHPAIKDRVP